MVSVMSRRSEKGFTLIEVVVTFFIISIGLLGLLSLQVTVMNQAVNAQMRAEATALITDLSERIAMLPTRAFDGEFNRPNQLLGETYTECGGMAIDTPEFLLCEWNNLLNTSRTNPGLMAPQGAVGCIDWSPTQSTQPTRYKVVRIAIAWVGQNQITETPVDCGVGVIDPAYRRALFRDINVRDLRKEGLWNEI